MQFFTNPNTLSVGLIVLTLVCIVLIVILVQMNKKLKKFLVGIDSGHIGDSLSHISKNLEDFAKFRAELETYLEGVEKRLRKSVRSVETVRFNPFQGTGGGGNQSFSTAFLNEEGDGVVISSLYTRERVSVFSKPVKKGSSEYELSAEEKESLEKAQGKLK